MLGAKDEDEPTNVHEKKPSRRRSISAATVSKDFPALRRTLSGAESSTLPAGTYLKTIPHIPSSESPPRDKRVKGTRLQQLFRKVSGLDTSQPSEDIDGITARTASSTVASSTSLMDDTNNKSIEIPKKITTPIRDHVEDTTRTSLSKSPPNDSSDRRGLWGLLQRRHTAPANVALPADSSAEIQLLEELAEYHPTELPVQVSERVLLTNKQAPSSTLNHIPADTSSPTPILKGRSVRFQQPTAYNSALDVSEAFGESEGAGSDSGESSTASLYGGDSVSEENTNKSAKSRGNKRLRKRLHIPRMLSWFGSKQQTNVRDLTGTKNAAVNNPVLHLMTAALKADQENDVPSVDFDYDAQSVHVDDRSSIHSIFAPDQDQEQGTFSDDEQLQSPLLSDEGPDVISPDSDSDRDDGSSARRESGTNASLSTAEKLQVAFELPDRETYRGEFACWLVRSVLLKGYMYLTDGHICFYARLHKESNDLQHSGFLRRRLRNSYNTYWFTLRDDILSFYSNSTDIYYPLGRINMKQVVKVETSGTRERGFNLVLAGKKYRFKADTEVARDEWLEVLRQSLVRVKNEGEDLRIVLPFANIVELDLSGSSSITESLRIKVVDDESSLSEEYYFAYFNNLPLAASRITELWQKQRRPLSRPALVKRRSMYDTSAFSVLPLKPAEPPASGSGHNASRGDPLPEYNKRILSSHRRSQSEHPLPRPAEPGKRDDTAQEIVDSISVSSSQGPSRSSMSSTSTSASEIDQAFSDSKSGPRWRRFGHRKTRSDAGALRNMSTDTGGDMSATDAGVPPTGGVERGVKSQQAEEMQKGDDFRKTFALPEAEELLASFHCSLHRMVPRLGKLYISKHHLCFKSKKVGIRTRVIVPLADIVDVSRTNGFGFRIKIITRTGDDIICEFHTRDGRARCLNTLLPLISEGMAEYGAEGVGAQQRTEEVTEKRMTNSKSQASLLDELEQVDWHSRPAYGQEPAAVAPMHMTFLTIGTRGDVQPYIALALRLKKDGHVVRIATHSEYQSWIESFDIEFREVKGNPAELMRLCVENGMFTVGFMREAVSKFRGWLDDLLLSAFEACEGTDLLIESPSAMAGIHIAEQMNIPYFAAFTMPWSRTRYYPHPFAVPDRKRRKGLASLGGSYNWMSHVMIEGLLWKGISGQVNRFRKKTLGRPPTHVGSLSELKVPFLYNFSPTIVPPPPDWQDWIHTTGYWFLDDSDPNWKLPADLQKFLTESAGQPIIYIGFGSIVVSDPDELTRNIVKAVKQAGVRAIVSKGWSARLATPENANQLNELLPSVTKSTSPEPSGSLPVEAKDSASSSSEAVAAKASSDLESSKFQFPPEIYFLTSSAPHSILLPLCSAAVHHGGAGTTAACLRAGIPTAIHPFFGDQFFWANRIEDLGIGTQLRKLSVNRLAVAFETLVKDSKMKLRARDIAERLSKEDGTGAAVRYIYRDLEFARARIRKIRDTIDERSGRVPPASVSLAPPSDRSNPTLSAAAE